MPLAASCQRICSQHIEISLTFCYDMVMLTWCDLTWHKLTYSYLSWLNIMKHLVYPTCSTLCNWHNVTQNITQWCATYDLIWNQLIFDCKLEGIRIIDTQEPCINSPDCEFSMMYGKREAVTWCTKWHTNPSTQIYIFYTILNEHIQNSM